MATDEIVMLILSIRHIVISLWQFDWLFLDYLYSSSNIYVLTNGYQDTFQLMLEGNPPELSKETIYWPIHKMLNL